MKGLQKVNGPNTHYGNTINRFLKICTKISLFFRNQILLMQKRGETQKRGRGIASAGPVFQYNN